MKMKIFTILIVFFALAINIFSQDEPPVPTTNYPFSLGPQLAAKVGISVVETPLGRQNGIALSNLPDFGITTYLPISETANLGFMLDIGYSTYAFIIKDFNKNIKYSHQIAYFSFNPTIYFDGFIFGFGLGFPLSGNYDGIEIKNDDIGGLAEFNFGYIYTIMSDETGRLNIFIKANYQLSKVFNNFPEIDPMKTVIPEDITDPINDSHNPRAAAISFGFNYMFNF